MVIRCTCYVWERESVRVKEQIQSSWVDANVVLVISEKLQIKF